MTEQALSQRALEKTFLGAHRGNGAAESARVCGKVFDVVITANLSTQYKLFPGKSICIPAFDLRNRPSGVAHTRHTLRHFPSDQHRIRKALRRIRPQPWSTRQAVPNAADTSMSARNCRNCPLGQRLYGETRFERSHADTPRRSDSVLFTQVYGIFLACPWNLEYTETVPESTHN